MDFGGDYGDYDNGGIGGGVVGFLGIGGSNGGFDNGGSNGGDMNGS